MTGSPWRVNTAIGIAIVSLVGSILANLYLLSAIFLPCSGFGCLGQVYVVGICFLVLLICFLLAITSGLLAKNKKILSERKKKCFCLEHSCSYC